MNLIKFMYNDGGRKSAGFKGETGDCVIRAISIATGKQYKEVYDDMFNGMRDLSKRNSKAGRSAMRNSSPRSGVNKRIYHKYILENGFNWIPTMGIGTGCKTHLREDELPKGILIVRLSKHIACVIDGIINDTHDCSREGTRCVYGYYKQL